MLFLLPLSFPKDKLIFSPSITHGRALDCNSRLRHFTVSVTFLNLLAYYQTGGVLVDQEVLPLLQSGMLNPNSS